MALSATDVAGIVPQDAHDPSVLGAKKSDGGLFIAGAFRIRRHADALQPESVGSAERRKGPVTAAIDRMVEPALANAQADLRPSLYPNPVNQSLRGLGERLHDLRLRSTETLAGPIGRRRRMGVGCEQNNFGGRISAIEKLRPDHLVEFGADDHQVEAEDQAAVAAVLQKDSRNLDRVEDAASRCLARRVAGKLYLKRARGHIAKGGSREHLEFRPRDRFAGDLTNIAEAGSPTAIGPSARAGPP
jgi:hypothetical protein